MQMSAYYSLAAALLCLIVVRDINCLPAHAASNLKKDTAQPQESQNDQQNVDQDVQDLENLKPNENSMSVMKSHSSVFTDFNGKKEGQFETKEELKKEGQLLARVEQKVKQEDDGSAPTPLTFIRTEVEIPPRGIHKVIENQSPNGVSTSNGVSNPAAKRKLYYPHSESDENNINIEQYKPYAGVQFSPLDMAEYIFWTGDERGVTLAIEEFLVEGLLTREEAISYLHDIKTNVEYLQRQYTEEQARRESTMREQSFNPIRKNLGFLEKARQTRNEANELMEVRQQMRDNINKKSFDSYDSESNAQLKQRLLQASTQGISDEDYENILERLRVADFLYTEYSLEEVIYQLAKVMFSQSLTRGSNEAQEALEKFTRFLETEAEMGRISRSLEKKVLDVLIAGLTDTLTEHPELVAVARESLGNGGSNTVDDQLLQQLLILNPSGIDKTETGKGDNGLQLNNLKNHRFMMQNKMRNPEPSPMKKNTIPASSAANPNGKSNKST